MPLSRFWVNQLDHLTHGQRVCVWTNHMSSNDDSLKWTIENGYQWITNDVFLEVMITWAEKVVMQNIVLEISKCIRKICFSQMVIWWSESCLPEHNTRFYLPQIQKNFFNDLNQETIWIFAYVKTSMNIIYVEIVIQWHYSIERITDIFRNLYFDINFRKKQTIFREIATKFAFVWL